MCCKKKIKQITKKKIPLTLSHVLSSHFLQVSIAALHLPFCSFFLCRLFLKFWKNHKNCMCTQGFISSVKNPLKKNNITKIKRLKQCKP